MARVETEMKETVKAEMKETMIKAETKIPEIVYEEIIRHCQTCTFAASHSDHVVKYVRCVKDEKDVKYSEMLSVNSCALKIWLANDFCSNLPLNYLESLGYVPYENANILHFLVLQNIQTKEQRLHQRIVSKILKRTKVNFDVDRILMDKNHIARSLDFVIIVSYPRMRLKIMLEHKSNINRIITNELVHYGDNNDTSQFTLLHLCGKLNTIVAARILLRAGAKINLEYTDGKTKTNTYRHLLNDLQLDPEKEDLRKFVKLLKGVNYSRNVFSRIVYRLRKRKLIAVLNSINSRFGIYFLTDIVADYVVSLLVTRL